MVLRGLVLITLIVTCAGLSDKDSELLHNINEGVTVNGMSLFQGDIIRDQMVSSLFSPRQKRALPRQSYKTWEKSTIPYLIDKDLGLRKLLAMEAAMRTWEMGTCLRFRKKIPSDTDYVRFTSGKGCFATIGRGDGEQLLSLGKGCGTPGFALHELAHVIGFFHEQSRPDRDDYVDVIWDHIREDKKEQFAKYTSDDIDPRGIPYDYLSITHYGPYDFRNKPGLQTLKVKTLAENPADMGQRRYLSGYDIIGANTLYQCTQHLEAQCDYGTRYIDTEVKEVKQYACKENGADWSVCTMPVMRKRKVMVCNWNKTEWEDSGKKIPPTEQGAWENEVDPTSDLCMRDVPYTKEITIPCDSGVCTKLVTQYRSVAGPCWEMQDDGAANLDTSSWSAWSPWSSCNKNCGRGEQFRVRVCSHDTHGTASQHCLGFAKSKRGCCMRPCVRRMRVSAPGEERYKAVPIVTEECLVRGRRVRGPQRQGQATEQRETEQEVEEAAREEVEEAAGEEVGEYTDEEL